jgi:hypothetical protein
MNEEKAKEISRLNGARELDTTDVLDAHKALESGSG